MVQETQILKPSDIVEPKTPNDTWTQGKVLMIDDNYMYAGVALITEEKNRLTIITVAIRDIKKKR